MRHCQRLLGWAVVALPFFGTPGVSAGGEETDCAPGGHEIVIASGLRLWPTPRMWRRVRGGTSTGDAEVQGQTSRCLRCGATVLVGLPGPDRVRRPAVRVVSPSLRFHDSGAAGEPRLTGELVVEPERDGLSLVEVSSGCVITPGFELPVRIEGRTVLEFEWNPYAASQPSGRFMRLVASDSSVASVPMSLAEGADAVTVVPGTVAVAGHTGVSVMGRGVELRQVAVREAPPCVEVVPLPCEGSLCVVDFESRATGALPHTCGPVKLLVYAAEDPIPYERHVTVDHREFSGLELATKRVLAGRFLPREYVDVVDADDCLAFSCPQRGGWAVGAGLSTERLASFSAPEVPGTFEVELSLPGDQSLRVLGVVDGTIADQIRGWQVE